MTPSLCRALQSLATLAALHVHYALETHGPNMYYDASGAVGSRPSHQHSTSTSARHDAISRACSRPTPSSSSSSLRSLSSSSSSLCSLSSSCCCPRSPCSTAAAGPSRPATAQPPPCSSTSSILSCPFRSARSNSATRTTSRATPRASSCQILRPPTSQPRRRRSRRSSRRRFMDTVRVWRNAGRIRLSRHAGARAHQEVAHVQTRIYSQVRSQTPSSHTASTPRSRCSSRASSCVEINYEVPQRTEKLVLYCHTFQLDKLLGSWSDCGRTAASTMLSSRCGMIGRRPWAPSCPSSLRRPNGLRASSRGASPASCSSTRETSSRCPAIYYEYVHHVHCT